ncbi:MAG: YdeI/OmpD-associated family protein [Pseudomonadota bacterium]
MTDPYPFTFEAEIERFGVGKTRKVWYQVLMLPGELQAELPFHTYPRLRVEGEIADVPVANAFIPTGDGRVYVIVGPEVRDAADVGIGDVVTMRFGIADQDAVDVPERLQGALDADKVALRAWGELTPGKKRAVSQHVKSAKTEPTILRRIDEALEIVTEHKGDLRSWRDSRKR